MPAAKMRPLGVFLASANKAQNAALRMVLEQQQDVRIVGGASDTHGVLNNILDTGADFLLLDWELPVQSVLLPSNGNSAPELAVPDLIAALRSRVDRLRIVILTLKPEIESAAMVAGADAVVAKTGSPEKMLAVLIAQIANYKEALFNCSGRNVSNTTQPCG